MLSNGSSSVSTKGLQGYTIMDHQHDKFCMNTHYSKRECNCSLIERVREDERNKVLSELNGE
jgi:hypothetical protein